MESSPVAYASQIDVNVIWVIIAAALVMLMQAGFTALESGCTRAKNTINVAIKNLIDFIVSVFVFWLIGYCLMFGESNGGWMGSFNVALSDSPKPMDYASFVFQATFAGTATTIVSGAVAERIRFIAYVIVCLFVTAIIYPVSGHWIWGSGGWLAELHMVDFAGSTVVHSLGAWVGLAGAIMLGPRLGRFNPDNSANKISGHSLVLAVIGVLVLWFGWFGFNGGSTLEASGAVAKIVANTMLAAATGGVSCFFLSMFLTKGEIQIEKLLNGVIGGLVAITAGCAVVEPTGAVMIGFLAGLLVYFSEWLVLHILRVDDPVNVVAAHGVAGAWGTLALAFFAPVENLPLKDVWAQAGVQLQGIVAVFIWGFGGGLVIFGLLRQLNFLRVSPDGERQGLNIFEHGASSGLLDTMESMRNIATAHRGGDGNLMRRVEIETGTEAGELAEMFNAVMDVFETTISNVKNNVSNLSDSANSMMNASDKNRKGSHQLLERTQNISTSMNELATSISDIAQNAVSASSLADGAIKVVDNGIAIVNDATQAIEGLADEVAEAATVIGALNETSDEVTDIINTIEEISAQTNLLALNAAIEAARAGEAGRGFAVVADEVRNLSHKTQQSTQHIQNMMQRLKSESERAVAVMNKGSLSARKSVEIESQANAALSEIAQAVRRIVDMSTEIAFTVEQQNRAVEEINRDTVDVSRVSQDTLAEAENTHAIGNDLNKIAENLNSLVDSFKVKRAA